jgi:hypothetical protein
VSVRQCNGRLPRPRHPTLTSGSQNYNYLMEQAMNRLTLLASLTAIAIVVAGCSAASGPTYNAYSVDASDGVRTYRVECGGIFETAATCTKVAERICGNKSVQPIEKIDRLRDASDATADPRTMDFKCESAARVQGAVKTACKVMLCLHSISRVWIPCCRRGKLISTKQSSKSRPMKA